MKKHMLIVARRMRLVASQLFFSDVKCVAPIRQDRVVAIVDGVYQIQQHMSASRYRRSRPSFLFVRYCKHT